MKGNFLDVVLQSIFINYLQHICSVQQIKKPNNVYENIKKFLEHT